MFIQNMQKQTLVLPTYNKIIYKPWFSKHSNTHIVYNQVLDEFSSVLMYYVFTNIVCTRRASQVMHVTDWCYQRENYSKL